MQHHFFTGRLKPALFDMMRLYVGQTVIILFCFIISYGG